ncbi:Mitochondrial pyruvate carrier 2 [Steccherinum ochraceum]|uniref:Mitochondrial pyruvate carrier n=1 Tax=Steccherinum ochraceum TaxID=92696 RepID=A0A4R0R4W2_9APHY|nr:Mitochondrial pyruvate carrier 2 [Steccherinum ochraceum]
MTDQQSSSSSYNGIFLYALNTSMRWRIAGPKTVFFWAPMMKWCLVAAGLKDLSRPAEKLSVSQNVALAATGFVFVRYCMVITPVNYSLAAVNFFVGTSGLGQLARIYHYNTTKTDPIAKMFGPKSDTVSS